ncbi:MAG: BCCT family transporter, partial [Jiangellales bacterium]
ALLILFIFLVTSADSGTFVLAMMTEDGDENPPVSRKLLWGMILAAMTLAITLVGTVPVARAMAVLGAVPFTIVLVVQMGAFVKSIRQEPAAAGRVPVEPDRPPRAPAETPPPVAVATEHDQDGERS